MSKEQQKQAGEFCWVELCSHDIKSAKDFYQSIMNWQYDTMPMPDGSDYTMMKVKDTFIAGGYQLSEEFKSQGVPPHWASYILVDDADATAKKAKSLGATLLREPFDVSDMGRMAVLSDPTGAVFYLWQPKKTGESLSNKTPGNFGWNELATNDTKKAGEFYGKLFGWELNAEEVAPRKIYTTFTKNEKPIGGMLALTEEWKGAPPHWGVYFSVANLDKAIEAIKQNAGMILYDPISIPEVGRFTGAQDPQGVHFSLIEFNT